ncbi:MAG: ATPase, T2SS/T4P/T4SS family [Deinococcales bacterium]
MPVLSIGDRRLGAILLQLGYVSDADLQRALERHGETGGRLADILIDSGIVNERRIARAIEDELGYPLVNLTLVEPEPEATALIDGMKAQELDAFPFKIDNDKLRVAFVDPLNTMCIEAIEDATGFIVEPHQALRDHLKWAIASYYPELGLEVPDLGKLSSPEEERLGNRLIKKQLITDEQLEQALSLQEPGGEPIGKILVRLGFLSEVELFRVLAEQANVPFLEDSASMQISEDVSSLLLRSDAVRYQAIPIADDGTTITVACSEPKRQPEIQALFKKQVRIVVIAPTQVEMLIERTYTNKGRLGEDLVQQGKVNREQLTEALRVQRKQGKTKPLGEVLVELGYVSSDEVDRALAKQKTGGGRLEDTLVQSGKLSPEMLARSLAVQLGYEFVNPSQDSPDPGVITLIPENQARRYTLFPYKIQGNALQVLMKDPRNVFAIDDLKLMTGREIIPVVAVESDIQKLIDRAYGASGINADELNKELAALGSGGKAEEVDTSLDDNAVVRTVDHIIREAILAEASDIHIEPTPEFVRVRFRIDGSLKEITTLPKASSNSIAARIKIMGGLDIAERRIPQDGRVSFRAKGMSCDLRLSTLPVKYGEKIVMRILQKSTNIPEIEDLGFSDYNLQRYKDLIQEPYGIFLITGPTGSGKSYTTFSTLKRIATPDINVTTIEDPIEYEIPGLNQSQVNNAAGMTFARALRSFLRQDPDIIMVGEIRDTETAKIAVEAALTGHLVVGTLHTNDAAGAITRLEEMGVELFNISASLVGVLAQRLVRKVCSNCKQELPADPDVLRRLGVTEERLVGRTIVKGVGCSKCNDSGYKGRMAIHELLIVDDHVRKAIIEHKTSTEIRQIAREKSGLVTLMEDGLEKALSGKTTLEEIASMISE